ncbi:MAG: PIN/TRAM domain-containing protein [Deinococcales bacterium]
MMKPERDPIRAVIRAVLMLVAAFTAFQLAPFVVQEVVNQWYLTLLGALLMSLFSGRLSLWLRGIVARIAEAWIRTSPQTVIAITVATILALVVGLLLNGVVSGVPGYNWMWQVGITLVIAVFLISIAVLNREWFTPFSEHRPSTQNIKTTVGALKLLDTNIIIEGRILEVARAGFLEGTVIVPGFVLRELQYFADSPNKDRRAKGRRGLDVLEKLRANKNLEVVVREFADTGGGVDERLIRAALEINASIVTNDFGLARVAGLQDVKTLSLHVLADALKPKLGAGDEINLEIVREGSQPGQGVGFLEDGTMVVIEDGLAFKGRVIGVVVQTVTQTSLGRMVFAKVAA